MKPNRNDKILLKRRNGYHVASSCLDIFSQEMALTMHIYEDRICSARINENVENAEVAMSSFCTLLTKIFWLQSRLKEDEINKLAKKIQIA